MMARPLIEKEMMMKTAKAQGAASPSNGLATMMFIAGTLLIVGAGAAAMDQLTNGQKFGMGMFKPAPAAAPVARKALISYMPSAYESWRRTDYVEPKSARAALDNLSKAMSLPMREPGEAGEIARDAALAHFDGPGVRFVIYLERTNPSKWAPPQGPVSIIDGKIFTNHASGTRNVVDLSLKRPDGLNVVIRGRARMTDIEPVLKQLGFWNA
jgi:hypothetical protein